MAAFSQLLGSMSNIRQKGKTTKSEKKFFLTKRARNRIFTLLVPYFVPITFAVRSFSSKWKNGVIHSQKKSRESEIKCSSFFYRKSKKNYCMLFRPKPVKRIPAIRNTKGSFLAFFLNRLVLGPCEDSP